MACWRHENGEAIRRPQRDRTSSRESISWWLLYNPFIRSLPSSSKRPAGMLDVNDIHIGLTCASRAGHWIPQMGRINGTPFNWLTDLMNKDKLCQCPIFPYLFGKLICHFVNTLDAFQSDKQWQKELLVIEPISSPFTDNVMDHFLDRTEPFEIPLNLFGIALLRAIDVAWVATLNTFLALFIFLPTFLSTLSQINLIAVE